MKYSERIFSESEIKLILEIYDMVAKQLHDEDLKEFINDCKEVFKENQKTLKELKSLKEEFDKLDAELKRYKSIVYLCEKVKDCDE